MSTIGYQFASVVECWHFGFTDNKMLFPQTNYIHPVDNECGLVACSIFLWSPPLPFPSISPGKWCSSRDPPLSVSWQGAGLWHHQRVRKPSESRGWFSKNGAENPVCNLDNGLNPDSGCIIDGNIPRSRLCRKLALYSINVGCLLAAAFCGHHLCYFRQFLQLNDTVLAILHSPCLDKGLVRSFKNEKRKPSESRGGFLKNGTENAVRNVDNRLTLDFGCIVDGNIPGSRLCGKPAQWKADSGNGDNDSLTFLFYLHWPG